MVNLGRYRPVGETENMNLGNPFGLPGEWFKGSLHIHSTKSDGDRTPDEVTAWYQSRGFHFIALTDHGVLSQSQEPADGLLVLNGMEIEGVDPQAGLFHLVGLGLRENPVLDQMSRTSMREAQNRLLAAGGLVIIAHPYWSGQLSKDLLNLDGCIGLEIYNGSCEVEDAKGYSLVHWDDLLAAGRRLWGLAVDDSHWHHGSQDAGLGWIWVRSETLSQEAILAAIDRGHFFSSTGPRIEDLRLEGRDVFVRCSPCVAVDFIGRGPHSRRVIAQAGDCITQVEHRLDAHQQYLRVACRDKDGGWAWSNPLMNVGSDANAGN